MNTKHILMTILAACFPLMGLSQTAESLSSDNKLTQQEVIELLDTPNIRTHVVCVIHHPPYREDFNAEKIYNSAIKILADATTKQDIILGYKKLKDQLGIPGVTDRASKDILDMLFQ